MDNTDYVSYEIAKKLKKCGFDWHTRAAWHFNGEGFNFIPDYGATFLHARDIPHWNNSNTWGSHIYSAPTLWEAQKFLREEKSVDLYVIPRYQNAYEVAAKRLGKRVIDTFFVFDLWDSKKPYPTYESALSAGLSAALKLIGKEE